MDEEERRSRDVLSRVARGDRSDFPAMPPHESILETHRDAIPRDARLIAGYAQGDGAAALAANPTVRGWGLGLRRTGDVASDQFALTVLVERKLPPAEVPAGCLLPRTITVDGVELPVDVEVAPPLLARPMLNPTLVPRGSFPRASGALSGSAISPRRSQNPCGGGTLTGTWPSIGGSSQRALTCCHVALGFGAADFLASFPASLPWLLRSPRGAELLASAAQQVGQQVFEIAEIDTPWPILVPWPSPLALAGAVPFVYVDGAAGPVRPRVTPPFPGFAFATPAPPPPPERRSVGGFTIRSAQIALPGQRVFKIGQTSGTTWGRIVLSFLQIPIPVPGLPIVILFDQILGDLDLGPGDSGSALLTEDRHYLGLCWGALPIAIDSTVVPGTPTCPVATRDLNRNTLAVPWWWHALLHDLDFT